MRRRPARERKRRVVTAWILALMADPAFAQPPVLLHAAGSLRPALTEVSAAFEAATGLPVKPSFGASGLLRERIAAGDAAEVFASADLGNPRMLERDGLSGPVVLFARNELCAFVRGDLEIAPEALLAHMLDPAIKLGTSTPKADPSGDYAWQVFARADAVEPGARAALEGKALRLTGGPTTPPAPNGLNIYGHCLAAGAADIFLAYRTNAAAIAREQPHVRMLALPPDLAVAADYGLTVMARASPDAGWLAMFILSQPGQAILARHGFGAPTLPSKT